MLIISRWKLKPTPLCQNFTFHFSRIYVSNFNSFQPSMHLSPHEFDFTGNYFRTWFVLSASMNGWFLAYFRQLIFILPGRASTSLPPLRGETSENCQYYFNGPTGKQRSPTDERTNDRHWYLLVVIIFTFYVYYPFGKLQLLLKQDAVIYWTPDVTWRFSWKEEEKRKVKYFSWRVWEGTLSITLII